MSPHAFRVRVRAVVGGALVTLPGVGLSASTERGAVRLAWRALVGAPGYAVGLVVERRAGRAWREVARRGAWSRRWTWAALVDERPLRRAA